MASIQVNSGVLVDIEELHPWDVSIEDIAHSLANTCRFNGHTKQFYSVAEHSWNVSKLVERSPQLASFTDPVMRARATNVAAKVGLLHDAHEAYVGDITRPIKPLFRGLKELTGRIDEAIMQAMGVNIPPHWVGLVADLVKVADEVMLATEKSEALAIDIPWPDTLPEKHPNKLVEFWTPEQAKTMFLKRVRELWHPARGADQ